MVVVSQCTSKTVLDTDQTSNLFSKKKKPLKWKDASALTKNQKNITFSIFIKVGAANVFLKSNYKVEYYRKIIFITTQYRQIIFITPSNIKLFIETSSVNYQTLERYKMGTIKICNIWWFLLIFLWSGNAHVNFYTW